MKRRTARELEASKVRARVRRRMLMGWPEARWHDPPRAYAPSAPLVYTEVQMAAVKSELAAAEKQLAVANGRIAAAKTALGG